MSEDLGYIEGYLGEKDKGRDMIDAKIPGLQYSMPVVKYSPEGGLSFPWLPRDSNEKTASKFGDVLKQTISDSVSDTFKYRLEKNPSLSYFEDPTYLSYDLIFDIDESPLFEYKHPNGVQEFLYKYGNGIMSEVSNRQEIYDEFIQRFFSLFQSGFDNVDPGYYLPTTPRAYYAESISGLDKLNEKITNYGEDKITITLTEDISMTALYLAELYNNLVYSYKSQKFIIPDNCVRFDMLIKISDMRNFKIPNPNYGKPLDNGSDSMTREEAIALENKMKPDNISKDQPYKSHIIYRLHDCNFDFFKSMNVPSDLTIGGFNAGLDQNPAKLSFDIYYKSVSREIVPSLIQDGITIRNKMMDLSDPVAQDKTLFAPGADATKTYEDRMLAANRDKKTVIPVVGDLSNVLQNRYKEVRGEMLSELVQSVKTGLGVKFHHPPNVYEDDIFEEALSFVKELLGTDHPTVSQVKREEERRTPPRDLDGIPPSDLDPNYHHFT